IAVVALGLGNTMRITVIAFGVVFPVLVNTAVGVAATRRERVEVARMYGVSRLAVIPRVMVPSAPPLIPAGLRIALPTGLVMMVVSDLIGGQHGLGFYLTFAQNNFDLPAMFATVFVIGIVGNVLGALYAWIENRSLPWASNL